jgi:uncharacterized cupin superfamily protein
MASTGIARLYREGPPGQPLVRLDLDPADFQSDLPEQHWHVVYENADQGMTVGVWTTTDMQEAFGPYPGDEFMILLEGDVSILDADGAATIAREGEAFLVHNTSPVSWKQEGFCRKFFVIYDPPGAGGEPKHGVVLLDRDALVTRLEDADPSAAGTEFAHRTATDFVSADGRMTSGLSDATGTDVTDHVLQSHKMIWMVSGEARLAEGGSEPMILKPGDVVFIPAGTVCSWACAGEGMFVHCTVQPG